MSILKRMSGSLLTLTIAGLLSACAVVGDTHPPSLEVIKKDGVTAVSALSRREAGGSGPNCLVVALPDGKTIYKCGDAPGTWQTFSNGALGAAFGAAGTVGGAWLNGYYHLKAAKHYGKNNSGPQTVIDIDNGAFADGGNAEAAAAAQAQADAESRALLGQGKQLSGHTGAQSDGYSFSGSQ